MTHHDYQLADALRLLRKPACTRMAGLLQTAQRLRTEKGRSVPDPDERLSHGYTMGQALAGAHKRAVQGNQTALVSNAPAALAVLLDMGSIPVASQLIGLIGRYGVKDSLLAPLRKQVREAQRRKELRPELEAAEQAVSAAEQARAAQWEALDAKLPAVPPRLLAPFDARIQEAQRRLDDLRARIAA